MHASEDIASWGAREIAAAVHEGRTTAVAVIRAFLEIVAAQNPALNALVATNAAMSLAEAEAVDARIRHGETPALAGVPLIVKDNIWAKGWRITQGSRLFADFVPDRDARAVALAREAGAVIIGIGACSEFAAKGVTKTPLHGTTHHPLDSALTPGGSSGGNAAALAAGMAPIALGTDAGGSSRRPAAHCGVVGFKPTQDAVPYGPGFPEPFWGVSVVAPMGRTVDDCAALFDVVGRGGPAGRRPLVVGYHASFGIETAIDADVTAAFDAAIERLRRAGVAVEPAQIPWPEGCSEAALMPLQHAGLAMLYGARFQASPDLFDPDLGAQIERGLGLSGVAVARAVEQSHRLRGALDALFARYDLLAGLTTPCTAWPHDQLGPKAIGGRPASARDHAVLTPRFNHCGLPALSLPCGHGRKRLPVGLQIVGPAGADGLVLAAAARFETILADPVS